MSDLRSHFIDQFRWEATASSALLEAAAGAAELPADVLRLMGHVAAAKRNLLARIVSGGFPLALWPAWSLDEIRSQLALGEEEWAAYLEGASAEELDRIVSFRSAASGLEFGAPARQFIQHALLHGQYHRGQIARVLREAGIQPPATDYILWKPAAGSK